MTALKQYKPMATPGQLIEGAASRGVTITDADANMIAFGVYKRGTREWDERERLRQKIGNCCLSFGIPKRGMIDVVLR